MSEQYLRPTNAPVTSSENSDIAINNITTTKILTPAPINYGGENISGDIVVSDLVDQINTLNIKLIDNINAVKKANNWDNSVQYDLKNKLWIQGA